MHRRNFFLAAMGLPFAVALGRKWIRPGLAETIRPTSPSPLFFVKGVYQQPADKMAIWKARGVNTIFTVNGGGDVGVWTDEAIRQDLYMVREPRGIDYTGQKPSLLVVDRAAFEKDVGEPRLLAFALIDEPSNLKPGGTGITYEGVTWRPGEIDAIARDWSLGKKPLWINHVGNHVNNKYLEKIMSDYADSSFIDWLSHDCYPIADGGDLLLDLDGYTSSQQGHAIDRLSRWSGGKPQFSIIGLTQFDNAHGRQTTPSEFRAQAWSSVIHGAIGVIYFTFMFRPEFSYDATPPELVSELERFNSDIDAIEHILVDTLKGGRRPFSVLKSLREPDDTPGSGLPFPFEACAIRTDEGEYKIIQNLSNERAQLTYEPWGLFQIGFDPYQCRRGYSAAELSIG
ncbi:hypothetical protein [Rhizobium sp. RAF56]|uniref:hypothetical protein n=1 Tax=Rhizobium sp. RAF56 TaxID=3233062 RepID=UPI003F9B7A24